MLQHQSSVGSDLWAIWRQGLTMEMDSWEGLLPPLAMKMRKLLGSLASVKCETAAQGLPGSMLQQLLTKAHNSCLII